MKVCFLGAGSFRTLPIIRGALAHPEIFTDGEIALFDLNQARAEAVGRLVLQTPEYQQVRCRVTWDAPVEAALAGADAVSIGFPCGTQTTTWQSWQVSRSHGFIGSDQLSPSGAFLSLFGGPIILHYAHLIEQYCPQAWFAIFANPVAVYSALVNNHTKARALGICAGYTNHFWDLTRLLGADELRTDYDVDVAGINHLSFILRGTVRGEELFKTLRMKIRPGWSMPALQSRYEGFVDNVNFALHKLIEQLENFDTMVFSTEGDGLAHLYYEEALERHPASALQSRDELQKKATEEYNQRLVDDTEYQANARQALDATFWEEHPRPFKYGRDAHHILVQILRGLASTTPVKVVTSHPCRGNVDDFSARTVLEYSQYLSSREFRGAENLYVPAPLHGLISALATHQTLLADAIANNDPKLLYQALYAYPIKQNTRASRALYRDLFDVHREEMPKELYAAREYFVEKD